MKTKRFYLLLVVVFATMLVVACGAPAAAPTATPIPPTAIPPTDTPVPPTPTPVPPTATSVPPTETPVPPTSTPYPVPQRILFIGDSFTGWNEGIDQHVRSLAASCNPPLLIETDQVSDGGLRLKDLWNTPNTLDTIREGKWDVVVLQEDLSMRGYSEETFHEYVRKFDEVIRDAGARTVLYMAQDYGSDDSKTSVEEIASSFEAIGSELGIDVAPVALAWQSASNLRPDLNLYFRDEIHPSILGTYLTTNVFHAILYEQNPEGCLFLPSELLPDAFQEKWAISEEEASFLQSLAWETVTEYEQP